MATWPARARLLPHVLVVVDHAQALDVEAETAARLLNEAAAYLRWRAQYQQARQLQEPALASFRRVLGDDHPDTLTAMNTLGEIRRHLGNLQGARDLLQQTLAARQRVLGPDHPDTVASTNNLAAVRRELGEP